METVKEIHYNLKILNFTKIIKLETNIEEYNFERYLEYGKKHPICGFCVECDSNFDKSTKSESFRLNNVSHGSHSIDFIEAMKIDINNLSDWHEEGVLFIMESPSVNHNKMYVPIPHKGQIKRPSKSWYWVHEEMKESYYPEYFKKSEYGKLVSSIICTFKLKNSYLTNIVKCGMNNDDGSKFENLDTYNEKVVKNCMDTYLVEEIRILKPKVIFAFGSKVHYLISDYIKSNNLNISLSHLPHPATRYLSNDLFKVLYFNIILKSLFNAKILRKG